MSIVRALVAAAIVWIGRWWTKNWDLSLLRILPLAGVISASVEIARHQNVTANAFALAICATFFLALRLVPVIHQHAKSNLEAIAHAVAGAGRLVRRLLG